MCSICSCLAALKHLTFIVCGSYVKQVWPPLAYALYHRRQKCVFCENVLRNSTGLLQVAECIHVPASSTCSAEQEAHYVNQLIHPSVTSTCLNPQIWLPDVRMIYFPLRPRRYYATFRTYTFESRRLFTSTHRKMTAFDMYVSLELWFPNRYKPERRRFDSRLCHWNFSLT